MSGALHLTPADARRAASLLLLREAAAGFEVLMLRRAERDGDMRSGACVFPGGVLDAGDRDAQRWCLGGDDAALSRRFGLADGGLDYAVAAVRETFEEVGLLLAATPDGRPVDVTAHAAVLPGWRERLQRGEASIAALCQALDLRLDLRGLAYTSHWLTPPGLPKRFDTRFFMVAAPVGQVAQADLGEALELMWLTPQQALDPRRDLKLLPVTRRTLQDLAKFASAKAAWQDAEARREIPLTMPRRASTRKGPRIVLPDELPYAEVARLDPDGRGDVAAELVPGVPVRLSPRLLRITAPNPGMMTGPGTNSYFVGDPDADRWALVDPGPADAAHLQALQQHAPGPVVMVLATHTHVDHSPGAVAAAQAFGAPVLGRRPRFMQGQDASFAPERELADGEQLLLGPGTTLRVFHTPGHASNHLCYLIEQERTLLTGDHVMQGSTVVINPPDGDMSAYLKALAALLDVDLQWLAPGHGFLVAEPHAVLRGLIQHRLRREAKVRSALEAIGEGALEDLLPRVYDDVPAGLHPVARRSLLAHLLKLQDDGVALEQGTRWRVRT